MENKLPREGFSPASVLLGYLLVAGGISAGLLLLGELHLASTQVRLGLAFGGGGFIGGWFAARASRGETVAEPAIGSVLLVGTLCALLITTSIGRFMWRLAQDRMTRAALELCGVALVGSLAGAFISEKLLGHSTRRSLPWVLYVALAVLGGCFLAFLVTGVRSATLDPSSIEAQLERDRTMQVTMMVGIAAGCIVAGLMSGASARTRILAASFVGAVAGVFGFFVLAGRFSRSDPDQDAWIAAAVVAAGGGLLTLLSAGLGWVVAGRRAAARTAALP